MFVVVGVAIMYLCCKLLWTFDWLFGFQNVPDANLAEFLKTAEQDPFHLIAFLQNGKLSGIYVAGDTITIAVPSRTVESAVFTLLASYFVFDVDYPRQYAMFFAVLQSLVLEQPYLKPTSKKYAFLIKKLRQATHETPNTSEEDEEPQPKKQAIKPAT